MATAKILIVEDESIIAMELEERLMQLGYQVAGIAADSNTALQKVKDDLPDLVLMDIHIQGLKDGIETAAELRARFSVPIIYLTAHSDPATLQRAALTEPYGYLIKPFREQEIRTAIEMTLYKRGMEKDLKQAEVSLQRLAAIVESASDAIYSRTTDGIITSWNQGAEKMYGYTADEVIGQSISLLMPPDPEFTMPEMLELTKTGEILHFETTRRCKNGEIFFVSNTITPIKDALGNFSEISIITRDISEHKQNERQLLLNSRAIESAAEGIIITNFSKADNPILYTNTAFQNMTGYSSAEVLNGNCRFLQGADTDKDTIKAIRTCIEQKSHFEGEILNYKKDGTPFWNFLRISPILDENGNCTHFVGFQSDITERKLTQEALTAQKDFLRLLNEMTLSTLINNDFEKTMGLLANNMTQLLNSDDCYITKWDKERQQVTPIVTSAKLNQPYKEMIFPRNEKNMTTSALEAGDVIAEDDVQNSTHVSQAVVRQFDIHSALAIPLINGKHKLGAVIVTHRTEHHFTDLEINRARQAGNQIALAVWDMQQEIELQRSLSETQALADIAQALSETESVGLSDVLNLIVTSAQSLISHAEQTVIHLFDEEEKTLTSAAVAGFKDSEGGKKNIHLGQGIAGQVLVSGETVNINDVQSDPRFIKLDDVEPAYRSLMVTPVYTSEQKYGTISIQSSQSYAFTVNDVKMLRQLGIHAAIAIQNAHLLENIQQALKESNALYQINQGLVASLDPQELLKDVVNLLQKNFGYYHVHIYVVDPENGDFVMREGSGEIGRQLKERGHRLHAGGGIVGYTAETGAPFFTNDVDKVHFFIRNQLLPNTKSELAAPIKISGNILGILDVQQIPPALLTQRDLQLVNAVADQLAIALQKANLYTDLQAALQTEKAIRNQMVQSEQLVTMGRLLASVSHELNNPLQAIQNALFLLREEQGISMQGKLDLDIVLSEAERMSDLIERLRTTYRPTQAEDFLPTQVNHIIKDIHALIFTHLRQNDIIYEFQPDHELPLIPALPNQMRQVILNLLMNAVEIMPTGGKITVATESLPDTNEILITVTDSGPGIAPDLLNNIFEPFVTNKQRGTGLGLTISYDIVMKHHGQITAENKLGEDMQGAIFKVWLPTQNAEIS